MNPLNAYIRYHLRKCNLKHPTVGFGKCFNDSVCSSKRTLYHHNSIKQRQNTRFFPLSHLIHQCRNDLFGLLFDCQIFAYVRVEEFFSVGSVFSVVLMCECENFFDICWYDWVVWGENCRNVHRLRFVHASSARNRRETFSTMNLNSNVDFLGIIQKWDFSFENRFFFENIISFPNFPAKNEFHILQPLHRDFTMTLTENACIDFCKRIFLSICVSVSNQTKFIPIVVQLVSIQITNTLTICWVYVYMNCHSYTFRMICFHLHRIRSDLFGFNRIFGVVLSISFDFHSQRRSFSNRFSCWTVQNASK